MNDGSCAEVLEDGLLADPGDEMGISLQRNHAVGEEVGRILFFQGRNAPVRWLGNQKCTTLLSSFPQADPGP